MRGFAQGFFLDSMAATPKAQEDLRDPAQTGLERQIFELRRRLKSAEQRAASESMAYEDQAKLAEAMTRAARAEAREREALARANAELATLVRSMESELETLRAEHIAVQGRTLDNPCAARRKENVAAGVAPAGAAGAAVPTPGRRWRPIPLLAGTGICLAAFCVAATLYVVSLSRGEDRSTIIGGGASVLSGDMLIVDGQRVRLLGIAAPTAGSPAGRQATRYLQQLIAGHDLRCRSDGRRIGGAILARCFIGAVDISAVMLLSRNAVSR